MAMVVRNRGRQNLPVGLVGQQHQQRLVGGTVQVDGSVRLGQPQLHAAAGPRGNDVGELIAVEGAFVLADHHGVERTVPTCCGG
jgi:hypothetical protein